MKHFTEAKRKYIIDICMEDLRKEVEKGIDRIRAMTDQELAAEKEYTFKLYRTMDLSTLKLIRVCLQEDPGDMESVVDEPAPLTFTRWQHYNGGRYISSSKLATNEVKHTETGEVLRLERDRETGELVAVPSGWREYVLKHPVEAPLDPTGVLVATHAKTGEKLVIYLPEVSNQVYARPLEMFFEVPPTASNKTIPRFIRVPN